MKLSTSLLATLLCVLLLAGGSSRPDIPLQVEYAGCRAVLAPGSVCVLPRSRSLSLWIEAPPGAQIEIRAAGGRIDAAGEPVQNGQRFSLVLPAGAERVDVLVEAPEGRASWSLALAAREALEALLRQGTSRDEQEEISQKMLLVQGSIDGLRLAAAREALSALRLPPDAPAESHFLAAFYQSLLAEKEGDYRSALAAMQTAVEIAERVKADRHLWLAEEQLALLLRGVGRSRDAIEIFGRLRRTALAEDPCHEAQLLNNQAWSVLLAREAGEELPDPAPLLERALERYGACADAGTGKQVNVLINLALAHLQERRLAPAKSLLARVREMEPHPPLPHTLWKLDLEARIALREERPAEALARFGHLEDLAAQTSSPGGRLRAAFGQARSHVALEDLAAALATLHQAETLLDEQSLQVPVHEGRETFMATRQAIVSLHVEILLDEGRTREALDVARHARSRMLRQLEHSDRLASLTADQRAQWEHLLAEYHRKRTALEERAKNDGWLPADQLRFERAARKVEAESAKKLLDQAFLVLKGSGEKPREEPPPLRPGELTLTYHPLPQGWVGFAADEKTVTGHRFELPPEALSRPAELSRRLLLPFQAAIERAGRIRILPSGPLRRIDFHALPFAGDILLARAPVVYGLDLPVSAGSAQPGRHALLVADPRGDLPGARAETRIVREALEAGPRPWTTEELEGSMASAESVRDRLASVDLLHYAGHGTFSGPGGWESSLLLAEETRLTLGDLLALDRVPAWVVLSGCDTGRSSTETSVESLGLAQALLLAGSQAVVATTRPADDRTVPGFFAELYRQWEHEPDLDLAVALQRAQLSWRQENPRVDWAGFRLLVP